MPCGNERRRRPPLVPEVLSGATDAEVLQSFLRLVHSSRSGGDTSPWRLRRGDVAVLVSILGTDPHEIERRLAEATACTPRLARLGRRLLVASVAALLFGSTAAAMTGVATDRKGGSPEAGRVTSASTAAAPAMPTSPVSDPGDDITAPSDLVRPNESAPAVAATPGLGDDGSGAPEAATTPPVAGPPVGGGARVAIDSVGIDLAVLAGGQAVIDRGLVAHYIAPGWEPPVAPGAPGTYWLAAHRTTHGAPFAPLPDVVVGAEVRVVTGDATYVYTVTSIAVTGLWPGDDAVYGTDPTAPSILLQTCIGADRLLVRGTLTSTSPT